MTARTERGRPRYWTPSGRGTRSRRSSWSAATSKRTSSRCAGSCAKVAALGPLIDSLRARGDTIVLLSELAGISKDQVMPALSARSLFTRDVELASFSMIGGLEWVIYWLFLTAVIIGGFRLMFIM